MKPLKHQEKFVSGYRDKDLLVHEGGTGKTVCACLWLKDGRDEKALVVCPKKVVRKWQKALSDWGTKATVMSKEEFKKSPIERWTAKVVDEADEFASPLFIAKSRSQLATRMYEQVRAYPSTPILLLTATPIRSNPWNLHTLLVYLGVYIPWQEWREKYYKLERRPYLSRMAYMPRKNWRVMIREDLEKYADIVLLRDIVDLPTARELKIKVETPEYEMQMDDKPFFDEHRWEQQNKAKEIIEIGRKFRKVLVFAYYREQIEELEKALSKDKETFVIHGGVKDQEEVIQQSAEADDCYFIVQASIGAGFDADTFSCVVFASMSYAVRDYVQMKFRVRRVHNLHPVEYNYLIGGRCDRAVLRNIKLGKDFVPSEYRATDIAEEEEETGSSVSGTLFEMA
jgi:superfamily II DNA or RNA helicase